MLTYGQRTGQLWRNDGILRSLLGLCYSGNGFGLNNPALQNMRNVGPIPVGHYTLKALTAAEIKAAIDAGKGKGPSAFYLIPDAETKLKMFGRGDFMIHWDTHDRTFRASEGCIVPLLAETFSRIHDGDMVEVRPE